MMDSQLAAILGLEKQTEDFGDVYSLRGNYHNYSCKIHLRSIASETGLPYFYMAIWFSLHHNSHIYSTVNPRRLYEPEHKVRKFNSINSNQVLREKIRNIILESNQFTNAAIYRIEVENDQITGYIDITQQTAQDIVNMYFLAIFNIARKIDWYLDCNPISQ